MNLLIFLYNKYKNEYWNYDDLSLNPNITWNIIINNPDKPWNYAFLSKNINITWNIVKNNPNKEWDYNYLSSNPNITWNIVKNNLDKNWNYDYLSLNPNITWDIVKNNLDKKWNYDYLSFNPNITWEIIQNNPDKPWNYWNFSENPNITWDIIQNNPNMNWNYKNLNLNINITVDFILLSDNPNITLKMIKNNKNVKCYYNIINYYNKILNNSTDLKYISDTYMKYIYHYFSSDYFDYTDFIYYEKLLKTIEYENTYIIKILRNPYLNINIIDDFIKRGLGIDFICYNISKNMFNYSPYFTTYIYKNLLINNFFEKCKEELICKICSPKRIINWNEDILLDKEHPLYGKTQQEIDMLIV
jgi:hypothetical protein